MFLLEYVLKRGLAFGGVQISVRDQISENVQVLVQDQVLVHNQTLGNTEAEFSPVNPTIYLTRAPPQGSSRYRERSLATDTILNSATTVKATTCMSASSPNTNVQSKARYPFRMTTNVELWVLDFGIPS